MAERPDPDALLAEVRREEERAARGRLTVFFGSAPGVGKTYAMLESARLEREEGRDVVVGIVETHGRYDTGALLLGLEILPRRKTEHKGVRLEELDLDAALARRPGLILVDELAHTNAPGSRHAKRWQDIEELLASGLDVYTTLNVQHLESQSDVIAQITQVIVRETVPDSVFEGADDVRLIDLPIDELLERLREGKVYVSEQAELARERFFREGNLIALRELALRLTAQRVDAQMREYREKHGIDRTWAAAERVLVCVSPSPASERVIRGARRLAAGLHADFIAAYVETPASLRLSATDRRRIAEHLRLAQSLGAETVTLSSADSAEEVTRFARSRNVTRIVVGKPTHARWRDRLRPSFLDQLVRLTDDIEVHVLTGESAVGSRPPASQRHASRRFELAGFVAAPAVVAATTGAGSFMFASAQLADVVMVYLLAVVLVSLRWGLWPSLLAAVLSVFTLDYFFIPPLNTFAVSDVSHVVTFAVMFIVAAVISGLTKRVRDQAEASREREIRTASLYSLSGALALAKTTADVADAGTKHVHDVFGARACVLVVGLDGHLAQQGGGTACSFDVDEKELAVAEWTRQHGRPAGAGTDTLPASVGSYVPLEASSSRIGVLGIRQPHGGGLDHQRTQHLQAFARQIAGALERTRLAERAQQAQLRIEAEQLRNSLLSSVSHDLRTPLAVITGTASTLLETKVEPPVQRELTEAILTEAERLNRLVRNLLDMTRLEAGAVEVKKEWQPLEEAVGAALERTTSVLGSRPVTTDVPADLPLVPYDSILLQQVLVNLLENAAKYTHASTPITVSARLRDDGVEVIVADEGPGLAPGEETRIFEKFYRAEKGRGGGVGLGLTICNGIITAHGGKIWAVSGDRGGVAFHFTLPIEGEPPMIEMPESLPRAEGA
ncbi:MAG: two-component system sensor histidine kinase KdbD [Myxococcales bacterium 68-20]|nr:sensor histidine kinase KdpD [Myxococcales bacterium]OJY17454.1 MAG: two-component system sensor histidine kinase KdbD [Myxococcales bacterium 68-20]